MNFHVTSSAVVVLGVLIMLRPGRLDGAYVVRLAVARETQLVNRAVSQQTRICRSMRRMASRAAFGLDRRVFIGKRPLLVDVALNASRIGTGCQSRLFQLKAAMRVVTIAATHRSFQHLVVERRAELGLNFRVATAAQLRVVHLQHPRGGKAGLFRIRGSGKHI